MFTQIQNYFKVRERRRRYQPFYEELKDNLEQYYVMFQINRLRFFKMEEWKRFLSSPHVVADSALREYAQRLTMYNAALQEYKDFEQWYNEDLDRKNQENGRILHEKKEVAAGHFKGLEPVIKKAVTCIESLLIAKD